VTVYDVSQFKDACGVFKERREKKRTEGSNEGLTAEAQTSMV